MGNFAAWKDKAITRTFHPNIPLPSPHRSVASYLRKARHDLITSDIKARQGKANHFNVLDIYYRKVFLWATSLVNKDKYESKSKNNKGVCETNINYNICVSAKYKPYRMNVCNGWSGVTIH
jgi:hypothetical protein